MQTRTKVCDTSEAKESAWWYKICMYANRSTNLWEKKMLNIPKMISFATVSAKTELAERLAMQNEP